MHSQPRQWGHPAHAVSSTVGGNPSWPPAAQRAVGGVAGLAHGDGWWGRETMESWVCVQEVGDALVGPGPGPRDGLSRGGGRASVPAARQEEGSRKRLRSDLVALMFMFSHGCWTLVSSHPKQAPEGTAPDSEPLPSRWGCLAVGLCDSRSWPAPAGAPGATPLPALAFRRPRAWGEAMQAERPGPRPDRPKSGRFHPPSLWGRPRGPFRTQLYCPVLLESPP